MQLQLHDINCMAAVMEHANLIVRSLKFFTYGWPLGPPNPMAKTEFLWGDN